jgi:hypothetical protein
MKGMKLRPSRSLMRTRTYPNNVIRNFKHIIMKRIFLGLLLAGAFSGLSAQSIDKAKELLKANNLTDAKTEIDNVLLVEKNKKNADAWYTKVKIYNAIAANDKLSPTVPDAYAQSFEALKKYIELDDKKLISLIMDQYKPVNEIYQGSFQQGANYYNAQKYPEALAEFKGALATMKYMNQKGWVKQNMDTTSTLYAGISAEKANNRDEAAVYYSQIADSGITKINNNSMIEIYKWLADYYARKGDSVKANKYLDLGQKYFPADAFWADMHLENVRKTGNKDSLFAEYEKVTKLFPDSALFFFNYGLELYQYASDTSTGKRPDNYQELTKRAQENLQKCLQLTPDYPQASLVMGQISYNDGVELQQQVKTIHGSKPEDTKKRVDLRQAALKKFDEAIPYFEKVDQDLGGKGKLKHADKTALKHSYDLLITIYEQKNNKDKSAIYTDKYNNVDKVH